MTPEKKRIITEFMRVLFDEVSPAYGIDDMFAEMAKVEGEQGDMYQRFEGTRFKAAWGLIRAYNLKRMIERFEASQD